MISAKSELVVNAFKRNTHVSIGINTLQQRSGLSDVSIINAIAELRRINAIHYEGKYNGEPEYSLNWKFLEVYDDWKDGMKQESTYNKTYVIAVLFGLLFLIVINAKLI